MAIDKIKFKISDVAAEAPTTLADNEIGINLPDGKIWTPDGAGGVVLANLKGPAGDPGIDPTISTSEPTSGDGADGDIWFKVEA